MIFPLLALFSALPSTMPIRSIDSATARTALVRAGVSVSPAPVDDWQVLGPLPGDSAVILRQGTEVARIAWDPRLESSSQSTLPRMDDSGWSSRLRRWSAPPTGIRISAGALSAVATGSNPIVMNTVDADMRVGWRNWVSVGAGARIERLLSTPPIAVPLGDSIVVPVMDWTISACGPGVCLEGRTRTLPVGAESWLQPRLSDDLVARRRGDFWRTSADSAFEGSWETRVVAHAGYLHYSWSRCPGLWNGSLQTLGLRGSQTNGVSWGAGAIWTVERLASWVELGFPDFALPLPRIRKRPIAWCPVSARLEWRSFRQFSASLQTTLSFPDPFPFSQPGSISP
ncbi:MAG: hypothetical protein IPK50_16950 [Fibrobacterota bacterium]|nr:hypothetical protein [Fibrobacterota bacterium]QQS03969.1 MAG: hypothetical protein IPK50_16950 [Fibrobacterota bacterium]